MRKSPASNGKDRAEEVAAPRRHRRPVGEHRTDEATTEQQVDSVSAGLTPGERLATRGLSYLATLVIIGGAMRWVNGRTPRPVPARVPLVSMPVLCVVLAMGGGHRMLQRTTRCTRQPSERVNWSSRLGATSFRTEAMRRTGRARTNTKSATIRVEIRRGRPAPRGDSGYPAPGIRPGSQAPARLPSSPHTPAPPCTAAPPPPSHPPDSGTRTPAGSGTPCPPAHPGTPASAHSGRKPGLVQRQANRGELQWGGLPRGSVTVRKGYSCGRGLRATTCVAIRARLPAHSTPVLRSAAYPLSITRSPS